MKKTWTVLGIAAVIVLAWSVGIVQGQQQQDKKHEAIYVSSEKAPFKEVVPGVSKASLWGDDSKGAYGAFTKFAPGYDAGLHTHTHDVWLVVLKGAYIYKDDAGEKRVGPGEFIRVPGGLKHSSRGDAKEGALFYEEASGKFDLLPVK